MKTREQVTVSVAGQEIRLEIDPEERVHVEKAAEQVSAKMQALSGKTANASPHRVAVMVAFQMACDLSVTNELLDDAAKLHEELRQQKETIRRLEQLLARVDDALTV